MVKSGTEKLGIVPVRGDVAIVGMACTFPGARDVATYWNNIIKKVDATTEAPPTRWNQKLFYKPDADPGIDIYSNRGGFIGESIDFNPLDFGMVPSAVRGGNPDQFLALRCALEAMADAGIQYEKFNPANAEIIMGRGSYAAVGQMAIAARMTITEDVLQILKSFSPELSESEVDRIKLELRAKLPPLTAETSIATIPNLSTGRIANRFDFMGANYNVDAACASSLVALEIAVTDLLLGKVDFALVGGVHLFTNESFLVGFSLMGALSRTGVCRPFDANSDGIVIAEGIGMLALKRLAEAERDGDRIYAVIKGVGTSSDGKSPSFVAPKLEGELLALQRAYAMNGIPPQTVGLIEAHGTATPVGDKVELQTLRKFFDDKLCRPGQIALGSVKSSIGHAMPASGMAGMIKAVLAVYHKTLPPSLHCEQPHELLCQPDSPLYLNSETRPWIHGNVAAPRRAGISAFGFGGVNAHAVIEEYTAEDTGFRSMADWESEVCVLSADQPAALAAKVDALLKHVEGSAPGTLKDVAHSLNTSIADADCRLAMVAKDLQDLAGKLRTCRDLLSTGSAESIHDRSGIYYFPARLFSEDEPSKVAFLFPGEGSQYVNMMLDLCLHFPEVRRHFDRLDRSCFEAGLPPLCASLFPPRRPVTGGAQEGDGKLWAFTHSSAAVLAANTAMFDLLTSLGIKPQMMAGHSAGEWTAMTVAGMLVADGLPARLTRLAADIERLEVKFPDRVMLALGADRDRVSALLRAADFTADMANDNCPHQVVIAVRPEDAEGVINLMRLQQVMVELLPFRKGYHSAAYGDSYGPLRELFDGAIAAHPSSVPVYAYSTAEPYPEDRNEIVEQASRSLSLPVRFRETIENMYRDGARIFIEVGPKATLTGFVGDILRGKKHLALAANSQQHTGLHALNRLLALLSAHRFDIDFQHLYSRRSSASPAWNGAPESGTRQGNKDGGTLQISLAAPSLAIPRPPSQVVAHRDRPTNVVQVDKPQGSPTDIASRGVVHGRQPTGTNAVLEGHFTAVSKLLERQREVMQSYLASSRGKSIENTSTASGPCAVIDEVRVRSAASVTKEVSGSWFAYRPHAHIPAESITIHRDISLDADQYLDDHRMGAVHGNAGLRKGIPVVPFTFSIEMMAQTALLLHPRKKVVRISNAVAERWMALETNQTHLPVQIVARTVDSPAGEAEAIAVSVQMFCIESRHAEVGKRKSLVARASVILADEFTSRPGDSRACNGALFEGSPVAMGADLYASKILFHGSRFQGISAVQSIDDHGLAAKLRTLPRDTLIQGNENPPLAIDPCFLDACGQLVGYWALMQLTEGRVMFPLRIKSLEIFQPNPLPGQGFLCNLRIHDLNSRSVAATMDVADAAGRLWLRIEGWEDWRFYWPDSFILFGRAPHENLLCEEMDVGVPGAHKTVFACFFEAPQQEFSSAAWQDMLAHSVLTADELHHYQSFATGEARTQWLDALTVIKDAARCWLRSNQGLEIHPSKVAVSAGEHGEYRVSGPWEATQSGPVTVRMVQRPKLSFAVIGDPADIGILKIADFDTVLSDLGISMAASSLLGEQREKLKELPPEDIRGWAARVVLPGAQDDGSRPRHYVSHKIADNYLLVACVRAPVGEV